MEIVHSVCGAIGALKCPRSRSSYFSARNHRYAQHLVISSSRAPASNYPGDRNANRAGIPLQ
jgi:hypothetical protein